jgi:RNA polymerase sigma-70 factor (ECF subfamily)
VESDDRKLVEAARQGDVDAFRQLVQKYQRKVHGIALGIVRDPDEAKDVAQEAFIRVHRSLASFDGTSQFYTWLYRIVTNLCIDQLRKRRHQKVEFDETVAQETEEGPIVTSGIEPHRLGFDPRRALEDKELGARLRAALDQLSDAHRAVLVMREVEGMSYQEMADQMGCSIGTIMSRLFHARKKMQALLCSEKEGEP